MDQRQVDALLVRHGADLFWQRAGRGEISNTSKPPLPESKGGGGITAAAVRQRIRLVLSRAPVAVVKITGTATGMSVVRGSPALHH